jgi:hypothetical protein
MIYKLPAPEDPIDQGDLIDGCPVVRVTGFQPDQLDTATVELDKQITIVLTQTCDLAQDKVDEAVVASVFEANYLVEQKILKAADIQGPVRAGRVWGWYFLPADPALALGEMIIDLRRLHTIRLTLLRDLCRAGKRRGRLQTPYREHLAKHFGDTFSRIGLPLPYRTV